MSGKHKPLPLPSDGPDIKSLSYKELVDHIMAMTARVNELDGSVLRHDAELLVLIPKVGTLERANEAFRTIFVVHTNKLTTAINEMREDLMSPEARKRMTTLPEIDETKVIEFPSTDVWAKTKKAKQSKPLFTYKAAFWAAVVVLAINELVHLYLLHSF
jgi:hypothetical protein